MKERACPVPRLEPEFEQESRAKFEFRRVGLGQNHRYWATKIEFPTRKKKTCPVPRLVPVLRSRIERKNRRQNNLTLGGEISRCFRSLPAGYGTGWSKKKRTQGPIFGSPVAGTPVRRGGALVRRPATAGPPGATPKPIRPSFIGRGCS